MRDATRVTPELASATRALLAWSGSDRAEYVGITVTLYLTPLIKIAIRPKRVAS